MIPRVIASDVAGVRVLTLNRPEARNALDGALISALYQALVAADAEPGVGAVVLFADTHARVGILPGCRRLSVRRGPAGCPSPARSSTPTGPCASDW